MFSFITRILCINMLAVMTLLKGVDIYCAAYSTLCVNVRAGRKNFHPNVVSDAEPLFVRFIVFFFLSLYE